MCTVVVKEFNDCSISHHPVVVSWWVRIGSTVKVFAPLVCLTLQLNHLLPKAPDSWMGTVDSFFDLSVSSFRMVVGSRN